MVGFFGTNGTTALMAVEAFVHLSSLREGVRCSEWLTIPSVVSCC